MSDSSAERVLSVGGHDIGYPHGHLGYLSQDEENALQNFKVFLEEKGLYKSGDKPSHDDQTLLYVVSLTLDQESAADSVLPRRFLRARKWVIKDAYQQFKDTEVWRKANQLEVLYDTIDVDAYEETRRLVRCCDAQLFDPLLTEQSYSILNGLAGEIGGLWNIPTDLYGSYN